MGCLFFFIRLSWGLRVSVCVVGWERFIVGMCVCVCVRARLYTSAAVGETVCVHPCARVIVSTSVIHCASRQESLWLGFLRIR